MSAHRSLVSSLLATLALGATPLVSHAQRTAAQPVDANAAVTLAAAMRLLDSARSVLARSGPPGEMSGIRHAQALLGRALTVQPNDAWLLHYLGYAIYMEGTLSYGLGRDGYLTIVERADSVLELAAKYASPPSPRRTRCAPASSE